MTDPAYPDPATRNVIEPDCHRCPGLAETRNRIAWGNGAIPADLMIVGEAPAAGHPNTHPWRGGNHTGLAYTSRHSGRRIRRFFHDLGYGPDACYYTNTVKCHPATPEGTTREPTRTERRTCFAHLRTELAHVDPRLIVTTGKHATTAVLEYEDIPIDTFTDTILTTIDCPRLGLPTLPILHPSYQDVWLSRLDLTHAEYAHRIGTILDEHTTR